MDRQRHGSLRRLSEYSYRLPSPEQSHALSMKQILQNLRSGATTLAEVPCPQVGRGQVLIRTTRSLISAGTERMVTEFGKANLIAKARQQPERVQMALEKIRTDGLIPTIEAIQNKLDQPLTLGYCNVGSVLETGEDVVGFDVGARVASNGKHAEIVSVPVNLCARIPDSVSDEEAAFTVIGAIALQGIRLANPTLGESIVVTGLGLIGQVAGQLLRAHGCRVLGIDLDRARLDLARNSGADVVDLSAGEDPIVRAEQFSRWRGIDAVIITAATKSSEPMHQAALMSRKRGRIVLVGVTGMELSRDDFYRKELSLQVSCSYGPGRYDQDYEEKGHDYPIGYVRWTEQRNFEAVLDMMADGRLNVKPLISHRFPLERVDSAYSVVAGGEPSLGILLEYPTPADKPDDRLRESTVALRGRGFSSSGVGPSVAFIGSGNYSTAVLIPAFKAAGARLVSVASSTGVSGLHAGKKYDAEETTTDLGSIFGNPSIDAVAIATRHDSHATLAVRALEAQKHVFVEKPLCLTLDELAKIRDAYARSGKTDRSPIMMVGFNRRFAPHSIRAKQLLSGMREPKAVVITVNAGAIPSDHWTQTPSIGGGRIVGEACHFVDFARFLVDSPIVSHSGAALKTGAGDTLTIQLGFADGSIATIHYFANGSKAFPKERIEVFSQGRILQLDNFRTLRGFDWPGFGSQRLWRQDKGQKASAAAFLRAVRNGGPSPIPFAELEEVSRVSIELATAS